jgi:hypothetical protein
MRMWIGLSHAAKGRRDSASTRDIESLGAVIETSQSLEKYWNLGEERREEKCTSVAYRSEEKRLRAVDAG